MATHGGPGRGGGKKKGSVSAKTKMLRAISAKAIAQGVTPLEVMLDNMRFYYSEADKLLANILEGLGNRKRSEDLLQLLKDIGSFRKLAGQFAVDAAPYVHAKLANIQVSQDPDNPLLSQEQDAAFRTIADALNQTVLARHAGKTIEGSVGGPLKVVGPSANQPTNTPKRQPA